MADRGDGRIVFVTSISAYTASVNRGEYCISKAGLSMSAALYANRLAACGIKVFEIRPGIIRTDMIAKVEQCTTRGSPTACCRSGAWAKAATLRKPCARSPTGCLDYCAGQVLNVDGGFHMRSL